MRANDTHLAIPLLIGIETAYVIPAKVYEGNRIVAFIRPKGATVALPPRSNRM